jgi:hypothetical protein
MFRSDSKPHMCLGLPLWTVQGDNEKKETSSSSSSSMARSSHPVSLMGCNKDHAPQQRWLLGDDDRVHSATNFDWCLTALPYSTQGMFWWRRPRFTMSLRRCTSDNNLNNNNNDAIVAHRQRFMLVGNGTATFLEPFVHSLHSDYKTHDIVRLAFWTKDDTATALDQDIVNVLSSTSITAVRPMLEIFKADVLHEDGQSGSAESAVSPIYTEVISSHSNVINIPAWKLFSSKNDNDDGPITLVARLGTAQSAEFTIQRYHPEPKKDSPTAAAATAASKTDPLSMDASSSPSSSLSSSVSRVAIVVIVVGMAMFVGSAAAILVRRFVVRARMEKDEESNLSVDKPVTTTAAGDYNEDSEDDDARTVESHSVTGDFAIL